MLLGVNTQEIFPHAERFCKKIGDNTIASHIGNLQLYVPVSHE